MSGGTFVGSRFIQRISGVLNFLMGWFKALRWQRHQSQHGIVGAPGQLLPEPLGRADAADDPQH
jgi:hypothetical protein